MKFTLNQVISTILASERINVCVVGGDDCITYESTNDGLNNVLDLIHSPLYDIIKDYEVDRIWYGQTTKAIIIEVLEGERK